MLYFMLQELEKVTPQNRWELLAGTAGMIAGTAAGVTIDVDYLERPSNAYNSRLSQLHKNIHSLQLLEIQTRSRTSLKSQRIIDPIIIQRIDSNEHQLSVLAEHKPDTPAAVTEIGVISGAAGFFAMSAFAMAATWQRIRRRRSEARKAQAQEVALDEKVKEIVDDEFERLELWLGRQKSD